jgi:hypothetical protein
MTGTDLFSPRTVAVALPTHGNWNCPTEAAFSEDPAMT